MIVDSFERKLRNLNSNQQINWLAVLNTRGQGPVAQVRAVPPIISTRQFGTTADGDRIIISAGQI